jgi:hypothetical protein
MADEATRAVGVPQGLPVGWVAPDSAILDRGDLERMRDGLRAGKTVAIASDGHVYVSGEATGQPMTPEAQQFIESRLGVVKQLVDMSGGMTIQPDGRMFGTFANQSVKVAMGPDPSLDQDEMNLVHAGIQSGATVAVLPDGSVQYQLQPGTERPSAADAQQRMAYFDEEVNSGRLGVALSAGHAVRMAGDVYQTMPPPTTPAGMNLPRPGDPEPAVRNPTNPMPGATPEAAVGPQLADTTPSGATAGTGADDASAAAMVMPGDQGVAGDVADNSPIATLDSTTDSWSPDDSAAVAYDDGRFDASGLPVATFDPSDNPYATDGADATTGDAYATAAGAPDDGGSATSDDSYGTGGDSYAMVDDGSTYDTAGSDGDDPGDAYAASGGDSYADSGGDSYSYASADTGGSDGGGYDGGDAGYDDAGADF